MLKDVLMLNSQELIERCRVKAARRSAVANVSDVLLQRSVVDALVEVLPRRHPSEALPSNGLSPGGAARPSEATSTYDAATRLGLRLFRDGYPVEAVVFAYGDLCQAIMEFAAEHEVPVLVEEFRALNHGLDQAIAVGVKEFSRERDDVLAARAAGAIHEPLAMLAHELRNYLHIATLAVNVSRTANGTPGGATAAVLDRCMVGMRTLIERSLADARANARLPARPSVIALDDLVAEIEASATLEARARKCALVVSPSDSTAAVYADRQLLLSAVGNLLQNAFKFTRPGTAVTLSARARGARVVIDVADACGGLPVGAVQRIFQPFAQAGHDRSGVGLGLTICRHSVEASGGELRVRDVPGTGCVFTIDLPRHAVPATDIEREPRSLSA